jgi:hypothetical protein
VEVEVYENESEQKIGMAKCPQSYPGKTFRGNWRSSPFLDPRREHQGELEIHNPAQVEARQRNAT